MATPIKSAASVLALAAMTVAVPVQAKHHEEKGMSQDAPVTAADARAFIEKTEKKAAEFNVDAARIFWINSTYITDDTDALAAKYGAEGTTMSVDAAVASAKYQNVDGLTAVEQRKLNKLRGGIVLPAPTTEGAATELNQIATKLNSAYGKGKGTLNGQEINGSDIEAAMGTNRNPEELKEMWTSWHSQVGGPMKDDYSRMVEIANTGARELGFSDVGAMWRSQYDMSADEFATLMDKLWNQVKPLYDELHCYTRAKLNEYHGDDVQASTGPIRADLLGNMWAQEWGNIYEIVAPKGSGDLGYDTTELLKAKDYDAIKMVKVGEQFFSSLGLEPLPETFWQRSQFTKPQDREVVCHASAWDIDAKDDIRIKMCIKVNGDDFVTIHHELGHNYYQRAYKEKSFLHQDGANDGFHEAIGDMLALAITPDYLVEIGLLDADKVPGADKDLGLLLRQAMDKVAFLPFGLLVDKWRWDVFNGNITPDNYTKAWHDLKLRYQGITPPEDRSDAPFDAGAKYHIPGNTPYSRYFLARILQFQFFKAACDQAGWEGPLHRCSFYGNKEVGANLNAMLEMGASKPWPDALEAFTGTREMDGTAMISYFAPLMDWLKKENAGKSCGW